MNDHELAAALAAEAGALLLEIRSQGGDAGDAMANQLLLRRLAEERPRDAVLSEEAADDKVRLGRDRVWIVDPLDGTREYGEPPRTDWAVHVALAIDGVAAIGAVALPGMDIVLHTGTPPVVPVAHSGPPRLVVSRSRPPMAVDRVVELLGATTIPMGSAGAKAMAVVRGEADVYVHSGGQYEWDSCAPVAVAESAGLHTSRIDGSRLRYNMPDPYLPDLVICRPELTDAVLESLSGSVESSRR
ncbi:3'(2'),5'-bisphosphate nucleotidase CysQ [Rhodococcus sp. SJ-2]